ncbi:hypothetical protein TcasGA2_TC031502 [Tribolium castaneum]|uniref:Uncharacterized protein n=1 Tax=Tribolium castaneum TaxID=7070 RepID=A0A139WP50_TRICA|nr:hypothetical protein TcasGA2_TC031502 [Tribolium castaneum]
MGCVSSKQSKKDAKKVRGREDNRGRLSVIWEELSSAEVLNLAKTDPEVYQICLRDNIIRPPCRRRSLWKMFGNEAAQVRPKK